MTFIATKSEAEATGAVAEMYDRLRGASGLPNWARLFSLKPEVLEGWQALLGAVREGQDFRRYELATLGAARALSSSYCLLAHGQVLLGDGFDPETLAEIARSGTSEQLSPADRAVLTFAAKVASDATSVTPQDIEALRAEGLSDREIFEVAATAAMRCFFSKLLDAMGTEPDAGFRALPEDLRDSLTRGRQIAK